MVKDLIQIPKIQPRTSTRRPPKKVPNWHLTSDESLKYIEESNKRTTEKESKKEKENKIKQEAVKAARQAERKANKKKK